jgi:hypothetical protein
VLDPDIRDVYVEMAKHWRTMADQQDQIDRALSEYRKPAE